VRLRGGLVRWAIVVERCATQLFVGRARMNIFRSLPKLLLVAAFLLAGCSHSISPRESARKVELESREALRRLVEVSPAARALNGRARGVLVFPSITKGGLIVGGQYGEGALFEEGMLTGYYNSVAVSYGLQAGVQQFGYALFFMSDADLEYVIKSDGWEVGVGPSIVVLDQGAATSLTSTTARKGVYAFFFEQKGLMAGLGLQGTKITRLKRP
jgi:lipid-binding SYLF domain-containing protein